MIFVTCYGCNQTREIDLNWLDSYHLNPDYPGKIFCEMCYNNIETRKRFGVDVFVFGMEIGEKI